jgi:hypothetical protein
MRLLSFSSWRPKGTGSIQGPVHHPFEHGKDILTFAPTGELHAYQLKGPDLIKLEDFERIQGQLFALAGTAITHAAVTPARRADRVFLVTNAALTPPVRDRIERFNLANIPAGWPPVEPIEREQLLTGAGLRDERDFFKSQISGRCSGGGPFTLIYGA